ncbi:MAG: trypsin-like serine protease [Polyangiaceae bacterium]
MSEQRIEREASSAAIRVFIIAAFAMGCSGGNSTEATSSASTAIAGGDTRDVTTSPFLPESAVGRVIVSNVRGGRCSGSVIARDKVLTASHCFCASATTLNTNPADTSFFLPDRTGGETFQATALRFSYFDGIEAQCGSGSDEASASADLAIIQLGSLIPPDLLPTVEQIYTGADFRDRIFNTQAQPQFFQAPVEMVGFAASDTLRKKGTTSSKFFGSPTAQRLRPGSTTPMARVFSEAIRATLHCSSRRSRFTAMVACRGSTES